MARAATLVKTKSLKSSKTKAASAKEGAVVSFDRAAAAPAASARASRRASRASAPSGRAGRSASGHKLRLVTAVEADGKPNRSGLGAEYRVKVAPGAIARIKLTRLSRREAWIDWVYVPPGYRDLGLGGQLLRRVLADADQAGVRLSLEARSCGQTGRVDQGALETWYERHGFSRSGRRGPLGPIFVRLPQVSREVA